MTTTQAPAGAVIYTRVSTERQAAEGHGLQAQLAACEQTARARGWQVLGKHSDEGISGRDGFAGRPGLQAAVQQARDLGVPLVVYAVSRLARSQRLLWQLLDAGGDYGLQVVSATEPFDTSTPIGRAMLGMLGVWAQLEGDMIRSRTKDGLAAAKAAGKKLGAPSTIELNPELVKRLSNMRRAGLSLRAIADQLNEENVQGARGGKWWPRTVRAVLGQARLH